MGLAGAAVSWIGRVMPEADRVQRIQAVLDRTGLRRSTLYRKIAEGSFPRQVKISRNGCGWRESEVTSWVADPERTQA